MVLHKVSARRDRTSDRTVGLQQTVFTLDNIFPAFSWVLRKWLAESCPAYVSVCMSAASQPATG